MCKRLMYLFSFILVLGLTTTSAGQDIVDGLVAYWPLDEGVGTEAADLSGNGSDGTLNGGPEWVEGKFGGALDFDGNDDYVDCGNPPILNFGTNDFTISAWIKVSVNPGGDTRIFSNGGDGGGGIRYVLYIRDDDDGDIKILVDDDGSGDYGKNDPDSDGGLYNSGGWHHIVGMRRDGTDLRIYIDGVEDIHATNHGDATIPADYDLSGTSQRNAYIGTLADADDGDLGDFFLGLIDDVAVWNRGLTSEEVSYLWNNGIGNPIDVIPPGQASDPYPPDEQADVLRDMVLSWTPGESINTHDVYFGTNFDNVNNADTDSPLLVGPAQDAETYDTGRLEFSQTYFWRIDEVSAPPDSTVFKGDIWSFTVEPFGYSIPGENIIVTASSYEEGKSPENTVNGSGLVGDLHSTALTDMWLSAAGEPSPAWIQFDFDKAYKLYEMLVWNYNGQSFLTAAGMKDVVVEYSSDDIDWVQIDSVNEFARASGLDDYAPNNTIALDAITAKSVKIYANSNWSGGFADQFGLSEVQFMQIPTHARQPIPEDEASDVAINAIFSWRAGREAATHDVYLSTDQQAVIDGTIQAVGIGLTDASYASSLILDSTYYWRIDEVNEAETMTTWQGDVRSFSTQEYRVVDDFESYNDIDPPDPESHTIFVSWPDGYGDSANGALIGNDPANPSYAETATVHGGVQAIPMFYSNTGLATFSEATRTFAVAQDWTAGSPQTLVLWFHGTAGNTGQLYVKINGARIPYDGDPGDITLAGWQPWNIDLTSSGLNLQSVSSLTIGVDGVDTGGKLYFDDIGLYALAPVPPSEWRVSASNDDAEEHGDWDAGAMEDFTSGDMEMPYEDEGMGEIQIIGLRFTGIPIPRGATITEAWVQFQVDDPKDGTQPVNLIIEGELSANSATFSDIVNDISSRSTTTAQVQWSVPNWVTVGDHGPDQATPSIASIIQEIVNQPGWSGGAIVLMFRDDPASPSLGIRSAVSFDGDPSVAALLHISYQ